MRSMFVSSVIAASLVVGSSGFTVSSSRAVSQSTSLSMSASNNEFSRVDFLKQVVGASAATAFSASFAPSAFAENEIVNLPSGVKYEIIKSGDGPVPIVGELAGIRFRANVEGVSNALDDCFGTSEPYYTRVGSGGLIKVRASW